MPVGRVEGKVAFITGAARGQGRSHALRLAQEGADIIAVDICKDVHSIPYAGSTEADLAETVKQVEALDRRIIARPADVRDLSALQAVADEGLSEFGHIDIVSANAGVLSFGPGIELTEDVWQTMLDINLTGVWKTVRATAPAMVERGQGGSIILTSSVAGLVAYLNFAHYVSAKHGVVGLMRALAVELAPHMIRVNTVHPTTTDTPMVHNPALYEVFGQPGASRDDVREAFKSLNSLPVPWVDPVDISNAVLFLASDESRYVTGLTMTVDAGATAPYKAPSA